MVWRAVAWRRALSIGALGIPAILPVDRLFLDEKTYSTDWRDWSRNLRAAPQYDQDPFSVNQIGHPYQGSMNYGLARSAGLTYWDEMPAR